jgi:cobaltochelatase CobN
LKGEKAEMLISNSARQNITIETIDKSIRRGIRARLLNPKWINGMLNHKHHGCEKIARRVENLIGLAATTHCVNSEYFSEINKKFVLNNEIREKLKENNKYGLMEIMERLFEAKERGYWTPDKDDLEKLREYYMELEGDIESYE